MTKLIMLTLLSVFLCCACASQDKSGAPSVIYPNPIDVPLDQRGVNR